MDKIVVNGESRSIDGPRPLADLLEELGYPNRWVIVERNGEPVPRDELARLVVEPGDRLEIAAPMAGG